MLTDPKKTAPNSSPDAALAAAGLPTGNTIWVNVANGILEAYNAYSNGTTPYLSGYTYVASIYVQESAADVSVAEGQPSADAITGTALSITGNTLIGFSAYANDHSHNLIVLRGTVTSEEAGYDLYGWGTNTACMLPSSDPVVSYGNVKQDLYDFYTGTDYVFTSLAASFNSAVQQVVQANPGVPCIVGAHSLGGALATLGALDAYVSGSFGTASNGKALVPWVITFGSLHLGDQSFATTYESLLPTTFRFANLCDFVPSIVSLEPDTPTDPYVHVGLECTFVWEKWDNWANHSMQYIYLPAVQNYWSVIQFGPRDYPQ